MSIGWMITLGYISGYGSVSRQEAERILFDLAHECADHGVDLSHDASWEGGSPSIDEDGISLLTYARKFAIRDDALLKISSVNDADGKIVETSIHLMASGGGKSRQMKEHLCRAYVRLLMLAMHHRGLDIQVSVA